MNDRPLSVADLAIVSALEQGPLSARELSDQILLTVKESWAATHGHVIDWDDPPVGASALACKEARDLGFKLLSYEIRERLVSLERRGRVERIQIDGHRPMLWRLP